MTKKRRNKRIKPKASVERLKESRIAPHMRTIESIGIAQWHPDDDAQLPAEQVHLILKVKNSSLDFAMRFKSPETLGFLIEELIAHRRDVWKDAEPVNANAHIIKE